MPAPVLSIAQMRAWEQSTWAAGQTEQEVIQRVGRALADRALALTRPGDPILLLAGKGHNGDDARAMQPHLPGRSVDLIEVDRPGEAQAAIAAALALRPALVVDGLFGIGLRRPLGQDWVDLIDLINRASLPVLAVDVPSGLNADTGEPWGTAIRATVTLTVGTPKPGLLATAAADWVGRLEVASDVGLHPAPPKNGLQWVLADDFSRFPPPRPAAGHKGTFGHLLIVAGSLGYHGASVLAARGAQRAQPGLVTLFTEDRVYTPVASQLQAVMVRPWTASSDWPETTTALLFGPGLAAPDLSPELKATLRRCWREFASPVIVDASALDWLPEGPCATAALRVITPHPGEAARLLKTTTGTVQTDRVGALRALSARYGDCWVVLKGRHTLVGRSQGDVFVNGSGNPSLGQGGSGDALAGYLGGLLAQPALAAEPSLALRYGVWQHGAAADALQAARPNWIVENLLDALGAVSPSGTLEPAHQP